MKFVFGFACGAATATLTTCICMFGIMSGMTAWVLALYAGVLAIVGGFVVLEERDNKKEETTCDDQTE